MRARSLAIVLALIGIAFAAYVEYGTTRAADVDRSFALFVFEAGPWALLLVLALLTPFARMLAILAVIVLALDLYAYYAVFVATHGQSSAVIYLYKPIYGLSLVAAGMLAGYLVSRANAPKA
jgi:preprotein translocase subunit SecD